MPTIADKLRRDDEEQQERATFDDFEAALGARGDWDAPSQMECQRWAELTKDPEWQALWAAWEANPSLYDNAKSIAALCELAKKYSLPLRVSPKMPPTPTTPQELRSWIVQGTANVGVRQLERGTADALFRSLAADARAYAVRIWEAHPQLPQLPPASSSARGKAQLTDLLEWCVGATREPKQDEKRAAQGGEFKGLRVAECLDRLPLEGLEDRAKRHVFDKIRTRFSWLRWDSKKRPHPDDFGLIVAYLKKMARTKANVLDAVEMLRDDPTPAEIERLKAEINQKNELARRRK